MLFPPLAPAFAFAPRHSRRSLLPGMLLDSSGSGWRLDFTKGPGTLRGPHSRSRIVATPDEHFSTWRSGPSPGQFDVIGGPGRGCGVDGGHRILPLCLPLQRRGRWLYLPGSQPGRDQHRLFGSRLRVVGGALFSDLVGSRTYPHIEAPQRSGLTFSLIFVALLRCRPYAVDGHWADTAQHWGGLIFGFLGCLALQRRDGRIGVNRIMAISLSAWVMVCALCYDPGIPEASPGSQPGASNFHPD